MAQRVNLDPMIEREDFAREIRDAQAPEAIRELKISDLLPKSAIRRQLRKPEFQRETNHWSPDQVVKFLTSFLDGDVIPSIILWRSTNFIFVIDGAHRLSAICAWLENDYGFGTRSKAFYSDQISDEQKRISGRTERMVNHAIGGTYEALDILVGKPATSQAGHRAGAMNSRPIFLQTVIGNAKVAEDSFFAINSQGTPLDDTETYLIKNRRKPVAIGARAIVRAGHGHSYWSAFSEKNQAEVENLASELHEIMFEPQVRAPIKTLDLPLGGSSSPVDALAVLIDFLTVASGHIAFDESAGELADDSDGTPTIEVLKSGLKIARRITTNRPESLGLHPFVYFTNDKGKHSRFLFLGMCAAIADKLSNNNSGWFKTFTIARPHVEKFLLEHKSVIGIVLQNLGKKTRTPRMKDMFEYLVTEGSKGISPELTDVLKHIGIKGRVYDITAAQPPVHFTEEVKSQILIRTGIKKLEVCPICQGYLDPNKSVSYDHITPIREGGLGTAENGQMVHPYCNTGMKN